MDKKTAVVIGTGAGGATIANELQGKYQVTILEKGKEFKPFSYSVDKLAKVRKSGAFFDERLIRFLLPNMLVEKTKDMVMVRGIGIGGTTTLATGNALRYDAALKNIGIYLDKEFEELYRELPISTDHQKLWTQTTKNMYKLFEEMGLDPVVTPKLTNAAKCTGCGHCAIGCPTGAKWDTRDLIEQAVKKGADLITNCSVTGFETKNNSVSKVYAKHNGKKTSFKADLIVLAAGGLGTPVILKNSGIECRRTLFVDPVLCVAGPLPGIHQEKQILMPFISQQDGYIISPYMDYLSFFFNKNWRLPMQDMASIMIKLADDEIGDTDGKNINKTLTENDKKRLYKAAAQCREILVHMGIPEEKQFLGTLNAGHPGGMLPLTTDEKDTLHNSNLPDNLYIADATILPKAMGNPPILTIMALAKRIAHIV